MVLNEQWDAWQFCRSVISDCRTSHSHFVTLLDADLRGHELCSLPRASYSSNTRSGQRKKKGVVLPSLPQNSKAGDRWDQ